jgi:hypothetical protein
LNGVPEIISFDHDLAYEHYHLPVGGYNASYVEMTGYDCARWLVENNLTFPTMAIIHSFNPAGAKRIASASTSLNGSVTAAAQSICDYLRNG